MRIGDSAEMRKSKRSCSSKAQSSFDPLELIHRHGHPPQHANLSQGSYWKHHSEPALYQLYKMYQYKHIGMGTNDACQDGRQ